jgi:hypothetical protein
VTYRLAVAASSTTASISAIEYCVESIRSVGDATPPLAMILTWWAPLRSSSRAAVRTAVTPSAMRLIPGRVEWYSSATRGARAAVPAGLAERLAAEEDPGCRQQALALRIVDPVVGAPHVADRGEPALEHRLEDACRPEGHVGRRQLGQPGEVGGYRGDVHVRVDETG